MADGFFVPMEDYNRLLRAEAERDTALAERNQAQEMNGWWSARLSEAEAENETLRSLADPDNHHNAALCPYCTHNGEFVMLPAAEVASLRAALEQIARTGSAVIINGTCHWHQECAEIAKAALAGRAALRETGRPAPDRCPRCGSDDPAVKRNRDWKDGWGIRCADPWHAGRSAPEYEQVADLGIFGSAHYIEGVPFGQQHEAGEGYHGTFPLFPDDEPVYRKVGD